MYLSRLTFTTLPGHTRQVEQKLRSLRDLVGQAGGTHVRVLRTHFASLGAPDLVFEQEVPDLPTLDEAGLKGFDMTTWWGVSVAAKTPQPVVDRLSADILKAMDAPDFKERLRNMGSEPPAVRTPEQFSAFVSSELKIYAGLVKRSGAKAD